MSINLSALQKQRRDTAANWTAENPTLLAGEIGLESDTGYWKVGDGATAWTSLAYVTGLGAEIPVSRLADGTARQLLQTAANGTDVEWTSNVDVPGTLDVTGAATFDAAVTIQGDLTVNGTTTTIDTQNLIVEDKNVIIGNVTTPTDVTADGGGITLKGTTDKTINWVDATDAWTLSEHINIASGKEYRIGGTKVLDATSLGSSVLITSANITDGTIVNGDINASAAIAGTKISPDFGSQNRTSTGTSTAASFIPTSSTAPTNGVYLPAANSVAISTNSTGRLFVDSSGRVGVGTNSPAAILHSVQLASNAVSETLRLQNSSDGLSAGTELVFASNNTAHVKIQQLVTGSTAGNRGSDCLFFTKADGGSISERMRLDSSGRLGIGTSTPQASADIRGTASASAEIVRVGNGTKYIGIGTEGTNYSWIQSFASASLCLNPLGNNVGIGSTTAEKILTVLKNGDSGLYIKSADTNHSNLQLGVDTANSYSFIQSGSAGSGSALNMAFFVGSTERARLDTSGRLLVGTSSGVGNNLLQVKGSTVGAGYPGGAFFNIGLNVASVDANFELGRIDFGNQEGYLGASIVAAADLDWNASDYPSRLVFSTTADGASSPTERMRITNSGHLKLTTNAGTYGSTAANYHEVTNTVTNEWIFALNHRDTANPYGITINYNNAAPNGTSNAFLWAADNTALRFSVRSNGGIANYSANNANLSDRNAKKDISPAADTWDCIKEWEIVNYRYKDQPDDADLNLGVIAQQVAESCPEVITVFQAATEDEPEKLGVKEQQMYWMAIKALQEAQVRIEALEAEVAALKAQ